MAVLAIAGLASATTQIRPDYTLQELAQRADAIVVGKCSTKNAHWVGGRVETDYEVQIEENWKGSGFAPGKSFRMTVAGGDTTSPPISQFTPMQTHMFAGEEVALFLKTTPAGTREQRAAAAKRKSALFETPRVIGMNEGKFSIFTDKDGKRRITRVNLERYGLVPHDETMQRVLRAVAFKQVPTTNTTLLTLGGGLATTPEGAAMLEAAKPGGSGAEAQMQIDDGRFPGVIPVQDLDEFKTQVQQFAH